MTMATPFGKRSTLSSLGDASNRRSDLGTLRSGAAADVTIIDPDAEWVVDPSRFASKGKNTPLAGGTLKGRVVATVFGGKVVYRC